MSAAPLLEAAFAHHQAGQLAEAEALYREAIDVDPSQAGACLNLTKILMLTERLEEAQRWLRWRIEAAPDDIVAHRQLGFAYASQNQLTLALVHFQRVIEIDPRDAGAHEIIAHLLKGFGRSDEARRNFDRSAALRAPVRVGYAMGGVPAFRVLMLFAPGAGNTPYHYMLHVVTYDVHVLSVVADVDYDIEALRASADIVFNLIGDVDTAGPLLGQADALLAQLGKPLVNDPKLIAKTDRESIATYCGALRDCVAPLARRYTANEIRSTFFGVAPSPFVFPLLVRRAGTHGGEDFEKVDDDAALREFIDRTQASHFYVTQYVDYRSSDGYYRKYRFMFVDGAILPYHLAIDDQWKIHHATTDMIHHTWMQDEERDFLVDPRTVFGDRQYAALRAIHDTIGLDYWGIDCALDRDGNVVVFEANATMLVHTRYEGFPYKNIAVARIKRAFDAMLERRAVMAAALISR